MSASRRKPDRSSSPWPQFPIWGPAERTQLLETLQSGRWWYGPKVHRFEEAFARFQGARYGITVNTGSAGLEVALLASGIKAGDEVIIPPYTFVATATAVVCVNAVPVFADIRPDTLCLDPTDVQRKITRRTRAIIPVHLAGHVADMDRLNRIARKHGLFVLEDACHAWGSQWKGKGTGALGDAGVFSFQVSKNINSAEGGIILTDDEQLAQRCTSLIHCGRVAGGAWYQHERLGSNLRLTEFQAAILLAQLTRLERQTLRRQANAAILDEHLSQIPGLKVVPNDPRMDRRSYHLYVFRIESRRFGLSRDELVKALVGEGIPVSPGYPSPLYRLGLFESVGRRSPRLEPFAAAEADYANTSCPVCEQVCQDAIFLPHTALLAPARRMMQIVRAVRRAAGAQTT